MKLRILLISLLILTISYSCQEGDGDQDYGLAYIYMPQAMVSGGLDNYFNVPSGGSEYTYNFKVQDGKLNVILGVLRSGKLPNKAYSVTVTASVPSSNILSAIGGVAMPSSIYSLPQEVNVPSDQSGGTFYLSIDADALNSNVYNGKKLVLIVAVSNPSNFELAEEGTSVAVVIDVDDIKAFL